MSGTLPFFQSRILTVQAEEAEKYPLKIQKLFAPLLPFLYKPPVGYPPEHRSTPKITGVSSWKLAIEQYKSEFPSKPSEVKPALSRRKRHEESLLRQLTDWEDTEAFAQNDFLKDPYRTVFISRLYYWLTELDISKHFNRFGAVESVRIIRDKSNKSRGYGFVVFARDSDASNCIRELAPTGLAIDPAGTEKPRKILVDMERGRLVRNWKPRRLGGGLGGRHYSSASAHGSRDASAASSGRRMNLSQNPYQQATNFDPNRNKRAFPDKSSGPNKRQAPSFDYYSSRTSALANISLAALAYTPVTGATARSSESSATQSIRDKYAKYSSANTESTSSYKLSGASRSIRSIRQRE